MTLSALRFATPDEDKHKYEVKDDKGKLPVLRLSVKQCPAGKTVDIPHPVSGLRVWNAEAGNYTEISPVLGEPESSAMRDDDPTRNQNLVVDMMAVS